MQDRIQKQETLAAVSAVRRLLEDLVTFEGPSARFPCPSISEPPQRPVLPESGAGAAGGAGPAPETAGEGGARDPDGPELALEALRQRVSTCTRCGLSAARNRLVFGAGDPRAGILFIGEAPGEEEDRRGVPFVGAAGELLTRIIEAMRLTRDEAYIANILKCRPPGNRDPREEEIVACRPYLRGQIDIIQPRVICTLGRIAAQALLETTDSLGRLRGRVHEYAGVPVVCTYHPAALLRNVQYKRPTWEDVKQARRIYDGLQL